MAYLDVLFPESISAGMRGYLPFNNSIARGHSGLRFAQINWDAPLRRWDVSHTIKDRETLAEFIDFWITVRGDAYSFKFWDPLDYEVGTSYSGDEISYGTPTLIGTGDGIETEFQLVKLYGGAVNPLSRKITKPINGTVKIYRNTGSGYVEVTSGVTINYLTGVVTFSSAPSSGHLIGWCGHFYCEAVFEGNPSMQLDSPQVGEWQSITVVEERP